jgi:tyrosyl-tRNA synthetase
LCTDLHPREVATVAAQVAEGGAGANAAKRAVARAVVSLYHGPAEAQAAEDRFDAVFKRREVPTDVPEFTLADDDVVHLPAVLVAAGLAASTSAARRDIDAGAVRLDGAPVAPRGYDAPRDGVVGRVLASGKRRAVRLV